MCVRAHARVCVCLSRDGQRHNTGSAPLWLVDEGGMAKDPPREGERQGGERQRDGETDGRTDAGRQAGTEGGKEGGRKGGREGEREGRENKGVVVRKRGGGWEDGAGRKE